jgi:hypothetical protein
VAATLPQIEQKMLAKALRLGGSTLTGRETDFGFPTPLIFSVLMNNLMAC